MNSILTRYSMYFNKKYNRVGSLYQGPYKAILIENDNYTPCVTMGWDCNPTLLLPDGKILPREAEMIINRKYYPNNRIGEWLCDPETGEKLPYQ